MSRILEFQNIKKSFSGREVLKGISFEVNKGDIVFILGTSGTGKSVLLKNLVGLLRPDSGAIIWHDKDISQYSEEQYLEVRKNCCLVFQQPALFDSMTLYENIAFGLRRLTNLNEEELDKQVRDSLKAVDLKEEILSLKPAAISYGMQKRLSIARSLCLNPEILLFDEPTTGLDPVSTQAINQLIFRLSRKYDTTSIVVSHDMHCALDIADYIIVLDKGKIVEQGDVDKIKCSEVPLVKDFLQEVLDANS